MEETGQRLTEDKKAYQKTYYEANKDKRRAYRNANKDKIKAYKKAYLEANKDKIKAYREANKDKLKAYQEANKDKIKAYLESNKDKIKARNRAYAEANKDKIKAYQVAYDAANKEKRKAYHEANKEKRKAYNLSNRDARRTNDLRSKYGLSFHELDRIIELQKGCCAICDTPFDDPRRAPVDHCHLTGVVRGLLCHTCNRDEEVFTNRGYLIQRHLNYRRSYPALQLGIHAVGAKFKKQGSEATSTHIP